MLKLTVHSGLLSSRCKASQLATLDVAYLKKSRLQITSSRFRCVAAARCRQRSSATIPAGPPAYRLRQVSVVARFVENYEFELTPAALRLTRCPPRSVG